MENENAPISKTALTYGIYLGVISVIYSVLLYVTGMIGNNAMGYVSLLFSIVIIGLAMVNYRDKVNGGHMSYGKGVGLGFLTAIIGGVISSLFSFILFKFIDPGLVDQLVNTALEEAIAKNPNVEAQIETVEKWTRMFVNPIAIFILGIISSGIGGVIISLILAAIFKKEKPMFEAQAE